MRVEPGSLIKLAVVHNQVPFFLLFLGHNETVGRPLGGRTRLNRTTSQKIFHYLMLRRATLPQNLIGFTDLGLALEYRSSLANPNRSVPETLGCLWPGRRQTSPLKTSRSWSARMRFLMSSTSGDTIGSWVVTTPPTREAAKNRLAPLVFRYCFTVVAPPPNNVFEFLQCVNARILAPPNRREWGQE